MDLSNKLPCEAGSFSRCHLNLHRCFQSEALRLYFPVLEPWVAHSVSLPTCFSRFIRRKCGTTHSASHRLACLVAQLPVSTPPTGLDGCVFFNSLVVELPYSSIFCPLWLYFVFKLLLSFFWLCKEAQCVYLRLHLGRNSHLSFLEIQISTKILKKFCM